MTIGEQRWVAPDLHGTVAVVTGASRGVGRGIALVLGECGATVYVTGRSTRAGPTTIGRDEQGRPVPHPETIEETAELVTARGGTGIPVRADHTVDAEVAALFAQVGREQGRLDLLVNNAWGGYENFEGYEAPPWEQPIWRWDTMFDTGARAHFVAAKFALPLMLSRRHGLIIATSYPDQDSGHIVTVAKGAVNALTRTLAESLHAHQIAAIAAAPAGWVWDWQTLRIVYGALRTPGGVAALYQERPDLGGGESPEYTGRAVASLLADPNLLEQSGRIVAVDELARHYNFTDIDGRQPVMRY